MANPDEPETFNERMGTRIRVKVVDVGANPIDGTPIYAGMLRAGDADLVGFDPGANAQARLQMLKGPHETYLPLAIGDGQMRTLHICRAEGMTSLLRPNMDVLNHFQGFAEWARIVATPEIQTVRLDDVPEVEGVQLLQLDIQGAELMALQNATERLKRTLVVHAEVEFLSMYVDQPLFSDVELFLRHHGFVFHRFLRTISRVVSPAVIHSDPFAGMSQTVWSDAVFIRDFTKTETLADDDLLALAMIMHDCYQSYDLTVAMLAAYDRRRGRDELVTRYLPSLRAQAA